MDSVNINSQERLFFIDLVKAISIVSVVSFHGIFVPVSAYDASAPLLDTLFSPLRFCVPVLLVISFFLLERSIESSNLSKKELASRKLTRLLVPTAFWFTISTLMNFANGNSLGETFQQIISGEIFTGAYYLIVLFQLIPLAIFLKGNWLKHRMTVISTVVMQMLVFIVIYGLAIDEFLPGITGNLFGCIRGLGRPPGLYWFAYLVLGGWAYHKSNKISNISSQLSLFAKFSLLGSLAAGFIIENIHLHAIFNRFVPPFEYFSLSSLLSGPIILLCFINIQAEDLSPSLVPIVKLLSRYSLGIFCINGTLWRILLFLTDKILIDYDFAFPQVLVLKVTGWIFLLALSLLLSIFFSKIGLKQVVC